MARIIFRDFDEFADAINGLSGRFIPTARSVSDWWIQVVPVGRLPLQQLQTGGATTFAGDGASNALTFGIPTSDAQSLRVDGQGLNSNSFILIRENQPFTVAALELSRWVGITVPLDHPALDPARLESVLKPSQRHCGPHTRAALQQVAAARALVARVCADDGSVELVEKPALRWAEEEIMTAAARLIEASSRAGNTPGRRRRFPRDRIVSKALELVAAREGCALFISDLCAATGVSERTLRNIFLEYFGVGPIRLLKVRQLREIRAALIAAEVGEHTVGNIAARFGVWDLSAFARNYKALYAETPSVTLRGPSTASRPDKSISGSWIRYASRKFSAGAETQRI